MVNFQNGVTPINDTNLNKAQTDLKEEINSFTKTIDANGWTVLNFGYHKEYIKKFEISISVGGNAWNSFLVSQLPTEMNELGNNILTTSYRTDDAAISANVTAKPHENTVEMTAKNQYGSPVTTTIYGNLRILELLDN